MVENRHIHIEISKGMYGLPQVGRLANDLLQKWFLPYRYYECTHTSGLWRNISNLMCFTLCVDDFGVKYKKKEDVEHLMEKY